MCIEGTTIERGFKCEDPKSCCSKKSQTTRIHNSIFICARKSRRENRQLSTTISYDERRTLVISGEDSSNDLVDAFPLRGRWTHRPLLTLCGGLSCCHNGNAATCRGGCYRKDHDCVVWNSCCGVNVVCFFLSCRLSWLAKALKNPNRRSGKRVYFHFPEERMSRASICANACAPPRGLFQYYWGLIQSRISQNNYWLARLTERKRDKKNLNVRNDCEYA